MSNTITSDERDELLEMLVHRVVNFKHPEQVCMALGITDIQEGQKILDLAWKFYEADAII